MHAGAFVTVSHCLIINNTYSWEAGCQIGRRLWTRGTYMIHGINGRGADKERRRRIVALRLDKAALELHQAARLIRQNRIKEAARLVMEATGTLIYSPTRKRVRKQARKTSKR